MGPQFEEDNKTDGRNVFWEAAKDFGFVLFE